MVGKMNYLRLAGVLLMGFFLGCQGFGSSKKAIVVFVDYTYSASIFAGEKVTKIQALLQELVASIDYQDELEVYPIHAFTETATPVASISGPELRGDLNDEMRRREWLESSVGPVADAVASARFARDRMMHTNIYPVVGKLARLMEAGFNVRAVLICDMIQDHDGEDFALLFGSSDAADPAALARAKVNELGLADRLEGVKVEVLIPGSPSGNPTQDRIMPAVNSFWTEFFALCGAEMVIRDL